MITEKEIKWIEKTAEAKPEKNKDFNEGWKNGCYAVLTYLRRAE